jgi:peptide/nickel transport system permease protein
VTDLGLATAAAGGELTPQTELARPAGRRGVWRLLAYLLTVWFLVTLNFALPRAMPGDPIKAMLATSGSSRGLHAEELAAATRYYGLDRPLWEQYRRYLGGLARGDMGVSIRENRPVTSVVAERLPWTLLLALTAAGLGTLVGMVAGVYSGWRRGRVADRVLLGLFTGLSGLPPFFLPSVAAFVFAVKLGWFPLSGAVTPFADSSGFLAGVADVAWHLVLPAATGSTLYLGLTYMTMRAGMVSELGADYLLLGRAKGVSDRRLQYGYAARNALLPMVTLIALGLGTTASSGVIFVETVFAYPGMGRLLFESIASRDYPAIQGCFLVLTLMVVTVNALADTLVTRLDPRTVGT